MSVVKDNTCWIDLEGERADNGVLSYLQMLYQPTLHATPNSLVVLEVQEVDPMVTLIRRRTAAGWNPAIKLSR